MREKNSKIYSIIKILSTGIIIMINSEMIIKLINNNFIKVCKPKYRKNKKS